MRIWGYIIFVIGVVFIILFLLAKWGGGTISPLPFFISVFLILSGINMVKSGKGVLQPTQNLSTMTEKIPMSQHITEVIEQQIARSWKIIKHLGIGFVLIFILIGFLTGIFDKKWSEVIAWMIVFGLLGLFTALMTVGAFWLVARRPVKKDLHEKNYLRTKGPIQVIPFLGGAIVRLADCAFIINGKNGMKELSKIKEGTVDYTIHAHIILAAWDEKGEIVYSASGYNLVE